MDGLRAALSPRPAAPSPRTDDVGKSWNRVRVVMETTLHRQLKQLYASDTSQTEVVLGAYRIDAIRDDELVEIQCASLSAIREKSAQLLKRHRLRVVKPVVYRTRIAKKQRANGPITSRRMSPKRGDLLEIFDELIYFTRVFPHENLTIEVPLIHVEQIRISNRKKRRRSWHKDYLVQDVSLESIESTHEFSASTDLLPLVGNCAEQKEFSTADIASATGKPRGFAQKIAYVLRKTKAIEQTGRNKTGIVYQRAA